MLFEPSSGSGSVLGVLFDCCPKGGAVVGVAQVGEFVHANVVGHVFGCADKPPVEADVAAAAYAPESFGAAEGGVFRNELQALSVCGEAGEEVGFGQRLEILAQAGLLLRPFGCGQEDAAWLDLDGGLVVGLQLVRLAVEPDMAGGCSRSGAVPEHLLQGGFIMLQPAAQLGQA